MASYNDKLDRLNGDDETRTSIVERLKMFDDQLEGIKAEEQEARDKLTALQQKEEKKYEDIPALKEVRCHRSPPLHYPCCERCILCLRRYQSCRSDSNMSTW